MSKTKQLVKPKNKRDKLHFRWGKALSYNKT